MDATIIFVNKANPITSITMQQLDAIYSRNRLGGAAAPAVVWGDLGVQGELAKRTINAYARAEGTATRASFATMALLKGEYRAGIIDREDSSALAEAVSTDAAGIGFGPMASWFATNKTLPVVPYGSTEARYPTQEMVTSSRYPMPRLFYAYLNRAPGKPVAAPVDEALHYILAQEGQNEVADVGLLPGPVEFMSIALKRLSR
jgi:phosphate transport system substrate-binding protein